MIIWRIRTLVDRLGHSHLTARQLMPYLIAAAAACTLAFVFADWVRPWDRDDFETAVDSLTTLANGLISAIGIYACYRANGGADGVQFAERISAIGFVVLVRFFVFGALALIIWAFATVYFNFPIRPSFEDFDLLSLLIVALFWVRVRSYVAATAQPGTL
jgi:hypothetical protein